MLGLKLVRLIEKHASVLSGELAKEIRTSERTSDFRKIPPADLQLAAAEIYSNLGEWLLQKTEADIEKRFREIGERRAAEGIGLHQFVWVLLISRDHLWHFLQREAFADNVLELYGQLELYQMLNQFFDCAVYYGTLAYYGEAQKKHSDPSPGRGSAKWAYRLA
jgi:hypothetical protein